MALRISPIALSANSSSVINTKLQGTEVSQGEFALWLLAVELYRSWGEAIFEMVKLVQNNYKIVSTERETITFQENVQ